MFQKCFKLFWESILLQKTASEALSEKRRIFLIAHFSQQGNERPIAPTLLLPAGKEYRIAINYIVHKSTLSNNIQ